MWSGGAVGWRWALVLGLLLSSTLTCEGGVGAAPGFSAHTSLRGRGGGRGPPEPCSHRGDGGNAVSARSLLADTVLEGKARSESGRKPNKTYEVTFMVTRVLKAPERVGTLLKANPFVRLKFREKGGNGGGGPCRQSYNFTRRPGFTVKANIKRGGRYFLFVNGVGPHNFTALGEPVVFNKKNNKAVKDGITCNKCGRVRPSVTLYGVKNTTVKAGERVRLKCRTAGFPPPAMAWYKDGKPINVSMACRIQYKKKRSSLFIPKVRKEDAGRYECRGTTVHGDVVSDGIKVTVQSEPDNTTTLWPLSSVPCPIPSYCLNGGTCTLYETLGEFVCQCADGYKGQRCESKDPYNRSSMYRSYFCKLPMSSSYYC